MKVEEKDMENIWTMMGGMGAAHGIENVWGYGY